MSTPRRETSSIDQPQARLALVGWFLRCQLDSGPETLLNVHEISWFGTDVYNGCLRPAKTRIRIKNDYFTVCHRVDEIAEIIVKAVAHE